MRTVSTPVVTGVVRVDVRTLQRAAPRVAPGRITARRLRSVASTLLGLASHFAVACGDDGAGPGGFSGEGTGPGFSAYSGRFNAIGDQEGVDNDQ
jgi:hypothetical protein